MFSALKKRWAARQDDAKLSPFPSGVAAIGQAMQTKFSKGVQYNSESYLLILYSLRQHAIQLFLVGNTIFYVTCRQYNFMFQICH